jgi:2'-5' RNA ligase
VTSERTRAAAVTRWRLFLALPVPDDAAAALGRSLARYRAAFPAARWLRPDLFHVTVRFLGGTDPGAVPDIADAITSVAAGARRIGITTGPGAGDHRAGRGSGVAWLTLAVGSSAVRELCADLDPLLPLHALASPRLRPPPNAHLTVARRAKEQLIEVMRAESLGQTRVTWTADRLVLYRSHTGTPAGSTYEPLAEAALGTRAAA